MGSFNPAAGLSHVFFSLHGQGDFCGFPQDRLCIKPVRKIEFGRVGVEAPKLVVIIASYERYA